MNDLDQITLLGRRKVAELTSMSVWTLHHWVKSGRFPKPIELTRKKHVWRLPVVLRWIEAEERKRKVSRIERERL